MKKWIAIILAVLLIIGNVTTAYGWQLLYDKLYREGKMAHEVNHIFGDPNQDGIVDAGDALFVLRYGNALGWQLLGNPDNPTYAAYIYESSCLRYYKRGTHINGWKFNPHYHQSLIDNPAWRHYTSAIPFLADVSFDFKINAVDALYILQYAVGNIDQFPRTDYTGNGEFKYMVWPTEWYPTMYYDLRSNGKENAYDSVADIFPDIPPVQTE